MCEIGDGVTHTIPIFDGFCLPHAVNRVDIGGRNLTSFMQKALMEEQAMDRQILFTQHIFH